MQLKVERCLFTHITFTELCSNVCFMEEWNGMCVPPFAFGFCNNFVIFIVPSRLSIHEKLSYEICDVCGKTFYEATEAYDRGEKFAWLLATELIKFVSCFEGKKLIKLKCHVSECRLANLKWKTFIDWIFISKSLRKSLKHSTVFLLIGKINKTHSTALNVKSLISPRKILLNLCTKKGNGTCCFDDGYRWLFEVPLSAQQTWKLNICMPAFYCFWSRL